MCSSDLALYHATYLTNSIGHCFGTQRFDTGDDSRNNALVALLTLGEGWHNNHHHYPASARHGFRWWELDLAWLGLKFLAVLGLVRDIRDVPKRIRTSVGERS